MDNKTGDKRLEKDSLKTIKKKKLRTKNLQSENHILRKRTPSRLPKAKNEIYVNNKTNFKTLLNSCEKIFDSDAKELTIHGLGKAINRACSLASHLKEIHHGTLELDTKISSVTLTDDLEPKTDDADYEVKKRITSSIHIRVYKTIPTGELKFEKSGPQALR